MEGSGRCKESSKFKLLAAARAKKERDEGVSEELSLTSDEKEEYDCSDFGSTLSLYGGKSI